jgi:acetyl-CoA carboxylase carboxyl transferase subunit alpha
MKTSFLEFEQAIAELETKIEQLRFVQDDSAVDISEEISRLDAKSQSLTKEIYAKLTPWQCALVARHPQRPYTLDYIDLVFSDFHELHGDRSYADDRSIVGGPRSVQWPVVHGDRPSERPGYQGKDSKKLRHASAGGLS